MSSKSSTASLQVIAKPSTQDILCGRGHQYYEHPGNRFFRETINDSLDGYVQADSKLSRTLIVSAIHKVIKKSSRFLRYEKKVTSWVELDDNLARKYHPSMLYYIIFKRDHHHSQLKLHVVFHLQVKRLGKPSDKN